MLEYLTNKLLEKVLTKDYYYYYDYINDMNKLKDENLKLNNEIKDLEKRLNNVIISKNEIYEKYINLIIKK
jgi:hypothetical protein